MAGKVTRLKDMFDSIDRREELPFGLLHGDENVTLILYSPQNPDLQQPHDQDEFYFVASGRGDVRIGDEVTSLEVGDAVFVPAHESHAFENHTADFAAWGLFYGPVISSNDIAN